MKNILFFFFFSFILLISCKEESITPIPETTTIWEKVADLPGDYLYLKTKGSAIYMVCYKDEYKFAVSQDSGKHWQVSNIGFLPNYNNGFLSVEGSTFFISGYDGLFKSTDNGLSWSEDLLLRNFVGASYSIPGLTSMCVESEKIYLGNNKTLNMPGHVKGIFYSSDNGETWSCPGSAETPWRVTAIKKIDNKLIVSDFKVLYSEDSLNTWQEASGGSGDVYEFIQDNSRIYAIAYSFLKYSDDKGRHWINCTPPFKNYEFGLFLTFTFNNDKMFIIDNKGIIHYSSKSNIEWKELDSELPAFDPFPYENQIMFTLGNDYLYYISNDKLWRKKITE